MGASLDPRASEGTAPIPPETESRGNEQLLTESFNHTTLRLGPHHSYHVLANRHAMFGMPSKANSVVILGRGYKTSRGTNGLS